MSNDLTQYLGGNALQADNPEYQGSGSYDALPTGEYPAEIASAEIKPTKAGNGTYVEFVLEVVGDNFAGRKLWHRCNINNPNPKAVEIGMQQLAEVARACGVLALRNCDEVVGKFVKVKVIIKDDRNEVKRVSSYGTGVPTTTAAPPQAATTTAARPMPWQADSSKADNVPF